MEIKESKTGRGGRRPGAGRKAGCIDRVTAIKRADKSLNLIKGSAAEKAVTAAAVLGLIDESKKWLQLLEATASQGVGSGENFEVIEVPDLRIQLDAMKYLTDQRDGKARQSVAQTIDDKRNADPDKRINELLATAGERGASLPN